jgi:hypothetical protein
MDVKSALKSQYHASLKMLTEAMTKCPDAAWDDPADTPARFWRVAYHTLFYTHFYLQQSQSDFVPWSRHRDEAQYIASVPWDSHRPPKAGEPFTREDLLECARFVDGLIDTSIDALDLSAPQCGFPWYPMGTFEHQIVNIRHLQHHAAALATRLRRGFGVEVGWAGRG